MKTKSKNKYEQGYKDGKKEVIKTIRILLDMLESKSSWKELK